MKIHHLRNATMVIESGDKVILIDPMLGKKGSGLPFSLFRFKIKRNPIVELPTNSKNILDRVTHCLVTHLHPDHLDKYAIEFLKSKNIPVICNEVDALVLKKKGLKIELSLKYWLSENFIEGKIIGIPARHGYGFIAKPMGEVMGFYVELQNDKSFYISGDTIYTDNIEKVLTELKPDIAVVACGVAQLDFGQPLLMKMNDILKFIKKAPYKVIANHMEALNHCPTTREELLNELKKHNLSEKTFVPKDGQSIEY